MKYFLKGNKRLLTNASQTFFQCLQVWVEYGNSFNWKWHYLRVDDRSYRILSRLSWCVNKQKWLYGKTRTTLGRADTSTRLTVYSSSTLREEGCRGIFNGYQRMLADGTPSLTSIWRTAHTHTLMPRPACETPGWPFVSGLRFKPLLDSSEVSVRISRPQVGNLFLSDGCNKYC